MVSEASKDLVLLPNQSFFLPAFQTQVTADSWAGIFPKVSIDLAPIFALSPHLSLCVTLPGWVCFFFFFFSLFFCLGKPRDIHGTEANNVELKTKFLRPYPSNKTITICSEDKPAIIHCILYTNSITCEGEKTCPFLGSLFVTGERNLFPCDAVKPKESKHDWKHLGQN